MYQQLKICERIHERFQSPTSRKNPKQRTQLTSCRQTEKKKSLCYNVPVRAPYLISGWFVQLHEKVFLRLPPGSFLTAFLSEAANTSLTGERQPRAVLDWTVHELIVIHILSPLSPEKTTLISFFESFLYTLSFVLSKNTYISHSYRHKWNYSLHFIRES